MNSAWAFPRVIAADALSNSAGLRTSTRCSVRPSVGAACSSSCEAKHVRAVAGIVEHRNPRRLRHDRLQKFQAFAIELGALARQARDARGRRPKWAASPEPTASATPTNTMGIVPVACLAATAAGVPGATITLGLSATSCVASSGAGALRSLRRAIVLNRRWHRL